jgi:UDP-glucose 4-epimerase
MRCFVTGGAGFIGSNLVDRLLSLGYAVTAYDNLSTGRRAFLEAALRHPHFRLEEGDLLDAPRLAAAMAGHDVVFHLAANADVRMGVHHPRKDLEQNTIATFHVLDAMRVRDVPRIAFSSTGSIYGEPDVFPTPENAPFPVQTSLYGASKLASEGLIQAFAAGFGIRADIFRYVSILGERYTHGHVFDFCQKLLADPRRIEVLGDGKQRKSYLYVHDCIDAMLLALERADARVNIFNLGHEESCTVDDSLDLICEYLGVAPQRHYTGGERGWVGDSPFILLDALKARALGWRPKLSIRQAILRTLQFLQNNPWLLSRRAA